jgi:hypothetical protein
MEMLDDTQGTKHGEKLNHVIQLSDPSTHSSIKRAAEQVCHQKYSPKFWWDRARSWRYRSTEMSAVCGSLAG